MLSKALNEEGGGYQPISLEQDGEIMTEKRAANLFARSYEEVCDVNVPTERRNDVREEAAEILDGEDNIPEIMTQKLSMGELQKAIRKQRKRSHQVQME